MGDTVALHNENFRERFGGGYELRLGEGFRGEALRDVSFQTGVKNVIYQLLSAQQIF